MVSIGILGLEPIFLDRLLEFCTYCLIAAQNVGLFTFYMQFKLTKSQLNF